MVVFFVLCLGVQNFLCCWRLMCVFIVLVKLTHSLPPTTVVVLPFTATDDCSRFTGIPVCPGI